jgi:D-alanine-D-alanine ligase
MTIDVLVLMGGPDAEREVSLQSGREVAAALRRCPGLRVIERVIERPDVAALREMGGEVVFPVLHGHWGEGGGLQALLEELGLPYVGSRPRASAQAMDKLATKMILSRFEVPTPPARQLMPEDPCDLEPPLVLKPVDDGSSVDLIVCHSTEQVGRARGMLHRRRPRLMAERYITGREVTIGILGERALPLVEIVPADGLYDYAAKYERDDTAYLIEPDLPEGVARRCAEISLLAFRELGCRDLARVDFIVDEQVPWFLEINTIPGFTTHSLVPMAARHVGLSMSDVCRELVEGALARRAPSIAQAGDPSPTDGT